MLLKGKKRKKRRAKKSFIKNKSSKLIEKIIFDEN